MPGGVWPAAGDRKRRGRGMCGSSHGVIVFMQAPSSFLRCYRVSRDALAWYCLEGRGLEGDMYRVRPPPLPDPLASYPCPPFLTLVGGIKPRLGRWDTSADMPPVNTRPSLTPRAHFPAQHESDSIRHRLMHGIRPAHCGVSLQPAPPISNHSRRRGRDTGREAAKTGGPLRGIKPRKSTTIHPQRVSPCKHAHVSTSGGSTVHVHLPSGPGF